MIPNARFFWENLEWDSLCKLFRAISSQILVLNCKLGISTVFPLFPKYMQDNIINLIQSCNINYLTLYHLQSVQSILDQYSLPSESLGQLKWLLANTSREESATNGVKILHQQHCKVSRYSCYFIYKDTRSPFYKYHKVFYFITSRSSINYQAFDICQ